MMSKWHFSLRAFAQGILCVALTGILLHALASPATAQATQTLDLISLSSSNWTPIGPAPLSESKFNSVSGRVTGIAAHPTDANTIYLSAAGGGVWKTTNGSSWTPLTDAQKTLSMGAIAISTSNPSFIYAGTGEAYGGNFGRGILISSDGGSTWTLSTASGVFDRLGTSQIAIDPTNTNVAYVAMSDVELNDLCCSNTGIWKTTDGGTSWTNTTTTIDSTDPWSAVMIDPNNPQTVYAAVGQTFGVTANGVYKSTDGGGTWTLLPRLCAETRLGTPVA